MKERKPRNKKENILKIATFEVNVNNISKALGQHQITNGNETETITHTKYFAMFCNFSIFDKMVTLMITNNQHRSEK